MNNQEAILLVEGMADKLFFEHLCRRLTLSPSVKVSSPREFGGRHDTKGAIFDTVPILLEQMADGQLIHLSVVMDSDFFQDGGGQHATLERFATLVGNYGFIQRHRVGEGGGYLFHHNDGLKPVGLWIMPDNASDGKIEDFIKDCISDGQKERFSNSANALAQSIKPYAFRQTHYVKAEIATWMAWQRVPGQGIFACVRDNLINFETIEFKRLVNWLNSLFS